MAPVRVESALFPRQLPLPENASWLSAVPMLFENSLRPPSPEYGARFAGEERARSVANKAGSRTIESRAPVKRHETRFHDSLVLRGEEVAQNRIHGAGFA